MYLPSGTKQFIYFFFNKPSHFTHDAHLFCSADFEMGFDDRVAAVAIATQFQEHSSEVFKMVEEETEYVKTQVVSGFFVR